ncbi:MAG: hypothetical protein JOZ69_10835 [Myxococcales bacterium]|nr:hypothetical protein [Myxococcales bacterium]
MTSGGSLTRTAFTLLPWQLVVRGAEAAMPILVATWFGRSEGTDVYYFGWALFSFAGSLVTGAFQDSAVIPVLTEVRARAPATLPAVRGSLLAHTLLVAGGAAASVGGVAALWFAARYHGAARDLALWMIAPLSLQLVATTVKAFFASLLNAERRYALAPAAGAGGALVALLTMGALRRRLSVLAIAAGGLAGEATAAGFLGVAALLAGIAVRPSLARPEPVRRIAALVALEVGGGTVTRLNPILDQAMAGLTGLAGAGTILRWSGDVASVPTSLLQSSLLPALLTRLSEDFVAGDLARLRTAVRRALASVLAILGAASAAMWCARAPILRLLFAHGSMDPAGVERIARVLPYHLLGVAPFGALLVLSRAHVALQNSGIMLSMGALNAALNALLDVSLLPLLGLEGLALSTSCTHALVAAVFFLRLEQRLRATAAATRGPGLSA